MYLQSVFTNFKSVSFTTTIIASKYSKNDFLLNTFILVYFSETVQLIKYQIIDFKISFRTIIQTALAPHTTIFASLVKCIGLDYVTFEWCYHRQGLGKM